MLYILFLLLLSQKCKSDTAVKKQKQTGSKLTRRVPVKKVKTKNEGDKLKGDTVAKKRRTKKKEMVSVLCLYVTRTRIVRTFVLLFLDIIYSVYGVDNQNFS